jgi:hypothetical protein
MSTLPENELDLEKLFLPAWAQEPPSAKYYAHREGEENDTKEHRKEGRPPPRREGGRGDRPPENRRREDPQGRPRRPFDRKPPSQGERFAPRDEQRERREPLPPPPLPPEVNLLFLPEERGVESLARQIKTTGRAYPLFDIARLILQKADRYSVTFKTKKKPDGQVAQPLFSCALDDTLWLSEDQAVQHVLKHHFGTFYQTERTATEPPKGKYTFVAQCGMSGVILGPPNHHDYQNQLRKLHTERFSRMPFEVYKSRVKIVRDEEVVKKWVEDQSWKTEYVCLNLPEPLRLANREAVENHFRLTHRENIIKTTESHTLSGTAARALPSPELARLIRFASEDQRRFPLQIATTLSQQFAGHGLQFFKVNRAITHVSVARPHFLDLETTPVSDGVKRIVDFINAHTKCTRRKIFEALMPSPPVQPIPVTPGQASPGTAPDADPPAATEQAPPAAQPAPPPAGPAEPTPEQTAVIADLHWLVHQGHVIEFANGVLETAKKPLPRPPKPERKPSAATSAATVPAADPSAAAEAAPDSTSGPGPVAVAPEGIQPDAPPPPAIVEAQTETPPAPADPGSAVP